MVVAFGDDDDEARVAAVGQAGVDGGGDEVDIDTRREDGEQRRSAEDDEADAEDAAPPEAVADAPRREEEAGEHIKGSSS